MFSVSRAAVGAALVVSVCAGGLAPPAAAGVSGDWMSTFLASPAGATDVHAAASDAGDLAVVWERGGAVEMAYSPPDVGFGTRVVVSAADSSDPRAAYDASGRLLVVWTSAKGGEPPRLMSRVMTDTGTWAAPVQIARRPGGTIRVADVAVNASGQAVVGWLWRDRALVTRGVLGGSWSTGPRGARRCRWTWPSGTAVTQR